jgi:hypothetical protein
MAYSFLKNDSALYSLFLQCKTTESYNGYCIVTIFRLRSASMLSLAMTGNLYPFNCLYEHAIVVYHIDVRR